MIYTCVSHIFDIGDAKFACTAAECFVVRRGNLSRGRYSQVHEKEKDFIREQQVYSSVVHAFLPFEYCACFAISGRSN